MSEAGIANSFAGVLAPDRFTLVSRPDLSAVTENADAIEAKLNKSLVQLVGY